jgi:tartrate dehydrogenase/decarboxylase/D-malate dehydrogenase
MYDPGIGIEVTASALEVLRAVQQKVGGFELIYDELDYGSEPLPQRLGSS